jgi:hypothetical protein
MKKFSKVCLKVIWYTWQWFSERIISSQDGHFEIVRILVESGADVNQCEKAYKRIMIMFKNNDI